MAEMENGDPTNWFNGNAAHDYQAMLGNLIPYLNVSRDCNEANKKGCFKTNETYKFLQGTSNPTLLLDDSGYSIMLADGTSIHTVLSTFHASCNWSNSTTNLALKNSCGAWYVDINGFKSPNQLGRDTFMFYLTKYGVMPTGSKKETES